MSASSEQPPHTDNNKSVSLIDDQVTDLMNSIENKLSMLACEDSIEYFQTSKLQSPKREYLTATNEKRNKYKMNINQLQTSNRKQTRQSPSHLGQSRILSRINEMEHYYMDKIQDMANNMANLEFQVENLNKLNYDIKSENILLKQSLARKEKEQNQIVNRKIQQLKSQLISKFSKQAEQHFKQHIQQMKIINNDLSEEKGKRKYLQQQLTLVKNQKNNLEQFYRNLLQNHRNMIKFDIQKSEKMMKQHSTHSSTGDTKFVGPQSSHIKKKNRGKQIDKDKEKQKINLSKRSQQMTREEMIPFLKQGILQLKEKLKLK